MKRVLVYCKGCLFLLLLSFSTGFSQKAIVLQDENKVYTIDSTSFEQLDRISPEKFVPATTNPNQKLYFHNPNTKQSYWYRYTLTNQDSKYKEWLLVSYNYSIDEIDLIIRSDKQPASEQFFRDTMSVYDRELQHKQPVFVLEFQPYETKTVYMRIKNESPYQYVFAVYSQIKFYSHFFKEYLWFGLFYGLMLFVLVYSIIYFIFLNDKVTLVYAFFIASQIMYMLFRDGNGVFLMPEYTQYADLVKNICLAGLSVGILLYTALFLKVDPKGNLYKVFMIMIAGRIIYTIFTLEDSTLITFHLELIVILFCTIQSIRFYFKGHADARYMSVGLALLSISYLFYYLTLVGLTSLSLGFFILYYGIAAESVFMTMALTERFKRIKLDNFRKEQMNKELESLVTNRTELLEEQSKELNLFLYSASHDLKGPLKTIKGLCNIAMMDKEVNHHEIYTLILDKLKKLESNITDLNSVTKIKNAPDSSSRIDFRQLHVEMVETFQEFPGFKELDIQFSLEKEINYTGDLFAVRCIYQNIFENAIKYRDMCKKSFIKIDIRESLGSVKLVFEDNGQGISEDRLPQIFNMFYRANEESREDTGLGLYIVKLAVQKLKGEIMAESILAEGTRISLVLPLSKK